MKFVAFDEGFFLSLFLSPFFSFCDKRRSFFRSLIITQRTIPHGIHVNVFYSIRYCSIRREHADTDGSFHGTTQLFGYETVYSGGESKHGRIERRKLDNWGDNYVPIYHSRLVPVSSNSRNEEKSRGLLYTGVVIVIANFSQIRPDISYAYLPQVIVFDNLKSNVPYQKFDFMSFIIFSFIFATNL